MARASVGCRVGSAVDGYGSMRRLKTGAPPCRPRRHGPGRAERPTCDAVRQNRTSPVRPCRRTRRSPYYYYYYHSSSFYRAASGHPTSAPRGAAPRRPPHDRSSHRSPRSMRALAAWAQRRRSAGGARRVATAVRSAAPRCCCCPPGSPKKVKGYLRSGRRSTGTGPRRPAARAPSSAQRGQITFARPSPDGQTARPWRRRRGVTAEGTAANILRSRRGALRRPIFLSIFDFLHPCLLGTQLGANEGPARLAVRFFFFFFFLAGPNARA